MFKRGVLVFLFLFVLGNVANAAEWVVERVTKDVSVSADGSAWRNVQVGDAVPNAYWVRTGPRARVLLAKGTERIMYRGSTLAAISVSQPSGKNTKVTQKTGSILLSVKKRRTRHTNVVTPHLAAVVKGTVFEVTVGRAGSDVRVDRGLVEVSDGDRSVSVSAGRVATAGKSRSGIEVSRASKTSLTAKGTVGYELADVITNGVSGDQSRAANSNRRGSSGDNGNGNSGGNGNGNSGGNGNGNSGGNGNGNSGGNGNGNSGGD